MDEQRQAMADDMRQTVEDATFRKAWKRVLRRYAKTFAGLAA